MDNFIPLPSQTNVAAVAPQSTVILASGIEWGNDYEHVRYYENGKTGCLAHVRAKAVKTFTQSTPVRFGELSYRGKGNESEVLKCNYLAFQNLPYSDEWFFGFITRVEWLSDNSFRIFFEPDRFQNSFYGLELKPCFVEREHVDKIADVIGVNLVPENLETGEYVNNTTDTKGFSLGAQNYVVLTSADTAGTAVTPSVIQTILSGLEVNRFTDVNKASELIQNYVQSGKGDSIVSVYQAPLACFVLSGTDYRQTSSMSSIDGYTPKNAKLWQYPYNYCLVSDGVGTQYTYMYEYGNSDHSITFEAKGTTLNTPSVWIKPLVYKNGAENNYSFILSNFPQCSWTNDAYQAWLAQTTPLFDLAKQQNAFSQIGNLTGGLLATIGGNLKQGAESIYNAATSTYLMGQNIAAQKESHDLIPPQAKGNISASYVATAQIGNRIDLYHMSVTAEMAKNIDDFFSMYGYATQRIKVPNITGRSSWNFVKTVNCGLHGTCILDDINFLQAMFNRGVTFWHTDDVGNYGLDNN